MTEDRVYVGLGSNQGDRLQYLRAAVERIAGLPSTEVLHCSSVYESEPVGYFNQNEFLNMALRVATQLAPEEFFRGCQKIENALGRVRKFHWGPRTIDIDVLFWGRTAFKKDDLRIPHLEIDKRKFVLLPLAELDPHFCVPGSELRIETLLASTSDTSRVELFLPADVFELDRTRG